MGCQIGCKIHNRRLRNFVNFLQEYWRTLYTIALPLILLPFLVLLDNPPARCAFMVSLMLGYGLPKAIPQTVIGLMPQFLMPVMGIMDSEESAKSYFLDQNMLNVGVFMIAIALENSRLNRRIALRILVLTKCNLRKLHVLFVCATALVSMCLENVPTVVLVLSIVRTVLRELDNEGLFPLFVVNPEHEGLPLEKLKEQEEVDAEGTTICFYLSIGYAATVGGIGSFTGSSTNKILIQNLFKYFPKRSKLVGFLSWLMVGFPLMLILIVFLLVYMQICYLGLLRPKSRASLRIYIDPDDLDFVFENLSRKRKQLGRLKFAEFVTALTVCASMVLTFAKSLNFVQEWIKSSLDLFIGDSTITMLISLVLFSVQSLEQSLGVVGFRKNALPLITWEDVQKRGRWDVILITGGSLAMAQGTRASGLIKALTGLAFFYMEDQTQSRCLFVIILTSVGVTAVVNNEAVCEFLLPILAEFCAEQGLDPVFLMLGVCLAASMSFCFEVGTPVNAIVVREGKVPDWHLLRCGVGMTAFSLVVLVGVYPLIFKLVFENFKE